MGGLKSNFFVNILSLAMWASLLYFLGLLGYITFNWLFS